MYDKAYFENRKNLILESGFRENSLPALDRYLQLLCSANEELNLISRKMTFEELINNHVLDCLEPLKEFPEKIKVVADFGSGGGLPAVLYAIQFPEIQFHLFEKSPLKQKFLTSCKSIAPNLNVHGYIPEKLVNIDLVIARAFKPIDVILELSRSAKKKFKTLVATVKPLQSKVLEVERHIVLI